LRDRVDRLARGWVECSQLRPIALHLEGSELLGAGTQRSDERSTSRAERSSGDGRVPRR
jgi:hypothetical protein